MQAGHQEHSDHSRMVQEQCPASPAQTRVHTWIQLNVFPSGWSSLAYRAGGAILYLRRAAPTWSAIHTFCEGWHGTTATLSTAERRKMQCHVITLTW